MFVFVDIIDTAKITLNPLSVSRPPLNKVSNDKFWFLGPIRTKFDSDFYRLCIWLLFILKSKIFHSKFCKASLKTKYESDFNDFVYGNYLF